MGSVGEMSKRSAIIDDLVFSWMFWIYDTLFLSKPDSSKTIDVENQAKISLFLTPL